MFQFIVETRSNLLRWLKHKTFKGTVLEKRGVGRIDTARDADTGKGEEVWREVDNRDARTGDVGKAVAKELE
jgi:hypothetical protein